MKSANGAFLKLFPRLGPLALLLGVLAFSDEAARAQSNDLIPEPALVSRSTGGGAANQPSTEPAISLDGGTVVFTTMASDAVEGDADRVLDIVKVDTSNGKATLLGREPFAIVRKEDNHSPSVNRDGTLVAFVGEGGLAPNDAPTDPDVFVIGLGRGTITLVSAATQGEPDGGSTGPVISDDGSTVVFISSAGNLDRGALGDKVSRVHIRDLDRRQTTRLDGAVRPISVDVSGDGRWVVFDSSANDLVPADSNGVRDVFLYDRETETFSRVSIGTGRVEGNSGSQNPEISSDGRYIAFESNATNLVRGDTNDRQDVYLHDRLTGKTTRVSVQSDGEDIDFDSSLGSIDAAGRHIAFTTRRSLTGADLNARDDVYLRDRLLRHTRIMGLTEGPPRLAGGGASRAGALSGDGLRVAFESDAANFDGGVDANGFTDVYLSIFEFPLPGPFAPLDGILYSTGAILNAIGSDGQASGAVLSLGGPNLQGLAIDEVNAAWVLSSNILRRVEASSLVELPAAGAASFPVTLPLGDVHGLVAGHGFGFVAHDFLLQRVDTLGAIRSLFLGDIGGPIEHLALALDPVGSLLAAVFRGGEQELTRFTLDFDRIERATFLRAEGVDEIAFDSAGNVFLRSSDFLEKRSPSLNGLWRIAVDGQGLAVDGQGNSYTTTTGGQVLGFRPDATRFFAPTFTVTRTEDHRLALDGAGHIWLLRSGRSELLRFDLDDGTRRSFAVAALDDQVPADRSGYVVANVFGRDRDADGEDILNGFETAESTNPFDPTDPVPTAKAPPILNPTARVTAADTVLLEWNSPIVYERFVVLRDGRELPGSPFPFAAAANGFVDAGVPGGPHVYTIRGEAAGGGGGGGGAGAVLGGGAGVGGTGEQGFEVDVVGGEGEGELLASMQLEIAPQAIAHNAALDQILVAVGGDTLLTLDEELNEIAAQDLNLAGQAVRGLAVDPDNAGRLFILTRDAMFERTDAGVAQIFAVDSPSEEGFRSLRVRNSTLLSFTGPDIDCMIGLAFNGNPVGDANVSAALGDEVVHSVGLGILGNSVLLGVAPIGTSETTITRVYRMNLSGGFALSSANGSVPLEAVASDDIADFDFVPGLGLVVADRQNLRVVVLRATFAGSIQLQSVTPPASKWDQGTEIEVLGTAFGGGDDVWLSIDGVDTPISSYTQNVPGLPGVSRIRATLTAKPSPTAVNVEVAGSNGPGGNFPGFVHGFQRGDANNDAGLSLADGVFILNFLFLGRDPPVCADAADVDDSGELELQDAVRLFNFLFLGGAAPTSPFLDFGLDGDDSDPLGCG